MITEMRFNIIGLYDTILLLMCYTFLYTTVGFK